MGTYSHFKIILCYMENTLKLIKTRKETTLETMVVLRVSEKKSV